MPLDNAIRRMREADADLTATVERGMWMERLREEARRRADRERFWRKVKRWTKRLLLAAAVIAVGALGVLASLGILP